MDPELQRQLEQVRAALVDAAVAAYEDAGVRGLYGEGAFEAMRHGLLTTVFHRRTL